MVMGKVAKALSVLALSASAAAGEYIKELRPDLHLPKSDKPLMDRKLEYWAAHRSEFKLLDSLRDAPQACVGGKVTFFNEVYECNEIDFLSFIGLPELIINRPDHPEDETFEAADIWGWLSPSGKEITILCLQNGVRFLDTTNPVHPLNLGYLPSNRHESTWCDVKVYKDHAFIVKDRGITDPEDGKAVQIFDLRRLEGLSGTGAPQLFTVDAQYTEHGSAHNIISNVETGFMYTVGIRGGQNCSQGLHIINVSIPTEPTFVACAGDDGYVHDAQCIIYDGPDRKYFGREICVGFDVDAMTIWDVTEKDNIFQISTTAYGQSAYTHQGWFGPGLTHILLDDELDEVEVGLTKTRTHVFDVTNLENPIRTGHYDHPINAIDHNLYVWGMIHERGWAGNGPMANPPSDKYAYHANYASGVRVVDISGIAEVPPRLFEAGFFDVSPDIEARAFFGSWSTYMHPSGALAVSSIERGMFMLYPRMAFGDTTAPTPYPTGEPVQTPAPVDAPTVGTTVFSDEGLVVLLVVIAGMMFLVSFVVFIAARLIKALAAPKDDDEEMVVEEKAKKKEGGAVANPVFDEA